MQFSIGEFPSPTWKPTSRLGEADSREPAEEEKQKFKHTTKTCSARRIISFPFPISTAIVSEFSPSVTRSYPRTNDRIRLGAFLREADRYFPRAFD
ncbi:hypothetical protein WN55_00633 [Dufourea novaeangliae]|uniref:Uncharacterized protein n=1 Tax=Dufourea novaeangliae TaxID=178035 RepID=A0A154NZY6_DUFNO|nr:hypothetical protein WN55_00633 [Dufourea novaeangliae]